MCIAMVSSAAMGAAVLCWLSSWNNAVALTTGNFPESRTVPLSSSPPSISIRPQLSPSEAQFGCTTRSSRFSPTRRHKSSLGDKLHLRPWTALPATKQLDGVPINGESDTDDTESSPWLTDPILQDAKLVSGTDETTALEPKERPEHPSAPPMTYKKYVTMNVGTYLVGAGGIFWFCETLAFLPCQELGCKRKTDRPDFSFITCQKIHAIFSLFSVQTCTGPNSLHGQFRSTALLFDGGQASQGDVS